MKSLLFVLSGCLVMIMTGGIRIAAEPAVPTPTFNQDIAPCGAGILHTRRKERDIFCEWKFCPINDHRVDSGRNSTLDFLYTVGMVSI